MGMQRASRGMRLHIGLYGRRNAGKSSLLNALTRQQVAIVSDTPGTTTDPVEKPMEVLPLGPVVFIDTAGVDDEGALGAQRVARTLAAIERTDLALLVAEVDRWGEPEESLLARLREAALPVVVVLGKADRGAPDPALLAELAERGLPVCVVSARDGSGLDALRAALLAAAPEGALEARAILGDLVPPGGTVLMVMPIDAEAPRGRLILPQVQALRDALDHNLISLVCQVGELPRALDALRRPPDLVVTDSQAFAEVAAVVPPEVPLTGFSVLFSRLRGELVTQARGVRAVERLQDGDRVLIAESCTHHPIGDDIGRVKIPRWLEEHTGKRLRIEVCQGRDFPEDLAGFALVVHCGGCMTTRRAMLARLHRCAQAGVPVTNYGVLIAQRMGILERALAPFPEARAAWERG